MADLSGKVGLVVGVANKRSISWAIAEAASRAGARLALTYQGERLEENVRELAATLQGAILAPCDVCDDGQIGDVFATVEREFGGLDFLVHGAAYAPREELSAPFVQTSRAGFRTALDISTYSLIALARGAAPLMERRGGGSILTLTYLGSERVFTNYNVMGVAKAGLEASVRYLAADLGRANIRVNAISAGPIKTLAASGISGFSSIMQLYRDRAPLGRNIDLGEVADTATFLLSSAARGITGEIVVVDAGFHIMGT
jgi:enoyl-[acyl-carrier protein] reductase I